MDFDGTLITTATHIARTGLRNFFISNFKNWSVQRYLVPRGILSIFLSLLVIEKRQDFVHTLVTQLKVDGVVVIILLVNKSHDDRVLRVREVSVELRLLPRNHVLLDDCDRQVSLDQVLVDTCQGNQEKEVEHLTGNKIIFLSLGLECLPSKGIGPQFDLLL